MEEDTLRRIMDAVREDLASRNITIPIAARMLNISEQAVALQLGGLKFNERTASRYSKTFGYDMLFLLTGEGRLSETTVEETPLGKSEMLDMIKEYLHIHKDVEFARFLGITSQCLYKWQTTSTFNAELLIRRCPELSGDWLLTGKGSMLKAERDASPEYLRNIASALVEQQRMTAKAQEQAEKMMEIMDRMLKK